jgi:hypothetical protein
MMKKGDQRKYGDGISNNPTPDRYSDEECCKGSPGFRTDYSDSMEPSRGPRTYPSVKIIEGNKILKQRNK